jgi:hypothetical protein
MGTAESRRAGGGGAGLADLRFNWGDAYDIGGSSRAGYTAQRRDGQREPLADSHLGGLRRQIRADYAALPVPRDLP